MTVFLLGYMGSGKSTIGQKLAGVLKFEHIDLDDYIEEHEQRSISELFRTKGELYFRKKESAYLQEILKLKNHVVSLGGGTPCYGNNMADILGAKNVKSIYLKTSIPALVNRLYIEKDWRPLISHINSIDDLTEFIGKHLFERSVYYTQADITITVDSKTVDEIVEEVIVKLF